MIHLPRPRRGKAGAVLFRRSADRPHQAFNAWNPFYPTWSFRIRRLVVKLLSANTLIDWMAKEFDMEVLYLLWHSVPVALSCLGLNWGNDAKAYLQNSCFREQVLGSEQARFADEVLTKGSPLQKFVLEWCLENFYPLQVYKERPWLVLTYEEVISRPKQVSELICSRFGLAEVRWIGEDADVNIEPRYSREEEQYVAR